MNVFSDTRTVKSMGICSGGVRDVRLFFCASASPAIGHLAGYACVRFLPLFRVWVVTRRMVYDDDM